MSDDQHPTFAEALEQYARDYEDTIGIRFDSLLYGAVVIDYGRGAYQQGDLFRYIEPEPVQKADHEPDCPRCGKKRAYPIEGRKGWYRCWGLTGCGHEWDDVVCFG